ncbi:MAG: glycosyltransferase family 4 protein [Desulfovibrionaceae bacterium]|nr:glycosyltransferase family 4 protein [Desulfovibrionaceae bacterium]
MLYTNFHIGDGGGHVTYILSLIKNTPNNTYVACPGSSSLYKILKSDGYDNLIDIVFYYRITDIVKIIKTARLFAKYIEEYKIDIVHTNGSPDNRMALYASLFCKRKFKVVFTKHNAKRIHTKLRLNKFNDAVVFVSEYARRATVGDVKMPHYHVIRNGIDLEYWRSKTPAHTGNALRLISTAGTRMSKGWMFLLEALASLLPEERQRLSVTILGDIPSEEARSKAAALFPAEFPGFFPDPRPWLEKADIGFILSHTDTETSSFASKEMLSMGLPLISSDYPNYMENIDDSCGWVTERRNPESIALTLRRILGMSPEELSAMKLNARKKAEDSFSIKRMAEETQAMYEKLLC